MFWNLNPRKLKPFEKAFKNIRKMHDTDSYELGCYIHEAVFVAVRNVVGAALSGNKSFTPAEYRKMSYSMEAEKRERQKQLEKNHDYKMAQVRKLFKGLGMMQAAFEANHGKKKKDGNS